MGRIDITDVFMMPTCDGNKHCNGIGYFYLLANETDKLRSRTKEYHYTKVIKSEGKYLAIHRVNEMEPTDIKSKGSPRNNKTHILYHVFMT